MTVDVRYTTYDGRIGDSQKKILVNLLAVGFEPSKRQAAMHVIDNPDQRENVSDYGYDPLNRLISRGLVEVVPSRYASSSGEGAVRLTTEGKQVAKQVLYENGESPHDINLLVQSADSLDV